MNHKTTSLIVAAGLGLAFACSVNLDSMPDDEPCKSVGYSIASRTLACTGDEGLANHRYDAFQGEFGCNAWLKETGHGDGPFLCSRQVNQLWCDRFSTCDDDFHCLLRDIDGCQELLTPSDGQGWHEESWDAGPVDGGGQDAGPGPITTLLSSRAYPGALQQDADALYFTTRQPGSDAGKVMRSLKNELSHTTLAYGLLCDTSMGTSPGPAGLALDATHVFVAVEGCETVLRVAKDGSESSTIATFAPDTGVAHVAVVGDEVFVALVSAFKIVAMAKDGSNQRDLVTLDPGVRVTGLAASATELFWTANGAGPSVQKVSLAGGAPTTLASGYSGASLPTVEGSELFFVDNQPSGSILRVSQDGSGLAPVVEAQPNPFGLDVDATLVVWSRQGPDEVVSVPRGGGAEEVIAADQIGVSFVLLDADNVYWTKWDSLMLLMRAKR